MNDRRRVAVLAVVMTALGVTAAARGGEAGPGSEEFARSYVAGAPGLAGGTFDPVRLVAAVNALHPLGKERALAMLRAHLDSSPGRTDGENVFLILRALFDLPPGTAAFPVMFVGAPDWSPAPADAKRLPRFPLALERDLPLFVINGYMLAGKAEDPRVHVDWCARNGVLRKAPLRPPDDPWAAADALVARTPELAGKGHESARAVVRMQVLRALAPVRPIAADDEGRLYDAGGDAAWAAIEKSLAARKIAWSAPGWTYTAR